MASEFEIEITAIKLFPESPFVLMLNDLELQQGSTFFSTSLVHLELVANEYKELLILHLEQSKSQYDFKIEPLSANLVLGLSLVPVLEASLPSPIAPFSCRYLNNISAFESHYENTKNILVNLEDTMGENYQKMLEDVVKAPSPSRSPVKNMPTKSGMKTPAKTPSGQSPIKKTFTSSMFDQGGVVEISCDEEIFMDKVSGKDAHSLMLVVAGLLAKKRFLKISDDESSVLKVILENNENAKEAMSAAFSETKSQIQAEREEISKKIEELTQVIKEMQAGLLSISKENEDLSRTKNSTQEMMHESEETIKHLNQLDVSSSETLLSRILEIRSKTESIEEERKQLQATYSEFMSKFREDINEKDKEVSRKQDFLNRAIADHNQKDVFLTHMVQDNSKLQASILETTSKLVVKMSQNDRVQLLSELIVKDSEAVHNLSERLEEIISKFEEIKSATESSLANIHSAKSNLDSQVGLTREQTLQKSSENESLQLAINSTKDSLREMKDLYERTSSIEQSFLNTKKRLLFAYENKEHTVREMKYLSDLILHLTSCYTSAHRSFNKANSLLDQKNCEVITIHNALEELKKKYPVYFPVKEDPLDLALGKYLNLRDVGLAVPFIREGGGVYVFGTRKVLVNYERGKLTVKVGGGFLPIEEFIQAYSDIELEKFTNKCQELSPKTKKFLGKWAGGLVDYVENQSKVRDLLKQAAEDHKYTISFAVKSPERSPSPIRKARTSIL